MENRPEPQESRPAARRAKRKRTRFKLPERPARAVRELWEQASQEDREKAHRTCMEVLEYWLGKKSKQEVATALEVPLLRVWQLSQQALSGMLAGLLIQPRSRRGRPPAMETTGGEDPKVLKKRVLELEKALSRTEDLVRVLRTAPWARSAAESPAKGRAPHAKKRRAQAKKAARRRDPEESRSAAPQEAAREGGGGGAG